MSIMTIMLFFIYCWSFGYALSLLLKQKDDFFETNIMRICLGLAVIPVLGAILNLIHIPIDWRVFLVLSIIFPAFSLLLLLFRKKSDVFKTAPLKIDFYLLIVLLLFSLTLFMHLKGAFSYPYLEDDDPWEHAKSTEFVAIERTLNSPVQDVDRYFYYLDPYPPGYEVVMGILAQTAESLVWVLKFFNALIIALIIPSFFFFCRHFMKNGQKAMFATFCIAMIPCFLSHFIWSHSLIVFFMVLAFYALERIRDDKRWVWIAGVVIASILLTQPEQALKFAGLLAIYYIIKAICDKSLHLEMISAGVLGVVLSLAWWIPKGVRMIAMLSARDISVDLGSAGAPFTIMGFFGKVWSSLQRVFSPIGGSASRAYTFDDFVFAKEANLINNPIGVGVVMIVVLVLSVLLILNLFYSKSKHLSGGHKNFPWLCKSLLIITLISLIMSFVQFLIFIPLFLLSIIALGVILIYDGQVDKDKNAWKLIAMLWLLFTFLGVNGYRLPLGFISFRFWMLFAIPVSILAGEGIYSVYRLISQKSVRYIVLLIILAGIIFTSGVPKYAVNTAQWPPGASWASTEELQGYMWLKDSIPDGSKVFSFAQGDKIFGLDKFMCLWCPDERSLIQKGANVTVEELSGVLSRNKYQYFVLDGLTATVFGENKTDALLTDIMGSKKFSVAYQNSGFIAFKLNPYS